MGQSFFLITAAFLVMLLLIAAGFKKLNPAAVITGLVSIGYSAAFDITFGDFLGLYYYVSPPDSTIFILLGAIFIYFPVNVLYLVFKPSGTAKFLLYTAAWITAMMLLEYTTLLTGSLVFTGWKAIPWSIVTYILTYLWINLLYGYLKMKMGILPQKG